MEEVKTGEEGLIGALNEEIKNNPEPEVTLEPGKEALPPAPEAEIDPATGKPKVKAEAPAPEDPEFDLGLDDKQLPIKLKRSQILEYQKNGMLQADYTKKTQELAAEKQSLKEVVEIIEFLKKNPSKAEKIVAILEAKEEAAKEQEVDLNKASEDIDKLLADLPDDDPYAQALRSQKAMIQQTLKVNEQLQKRLDQLDQGQKSEAESKIVQEADQALQEAISLKTKSLSFADQEESDYWKKLTLTYLVNNPKEYSEMNKEQFAEYFNKLGDKVYAEIQKIGEKHINRYIKSKGGPGGVPVTGSPLPAAPEKKPINLDNLQENLEHALTEEQQKTGT